jgi:hypothetical protein
VITNNYDFFHIVPLFQIDPRLDFGGNFFHINIYAKKHNHFIYLEGEWRSLNLESLYKR